LSGALNDENITDTVKQTNNPRGKQTAGETMCAQKLKEDAKKGGGKLPFGGKTFTLLFIRNQLLHRNELFRKE
jgi:hypothetical protein